MLTDRYFDSEERSRAVAEAKAEFPELAGRRICFFAPTFRKERVEDPPRYSCGWDYAEADVELERSNTAVVFKQHHIFKSLKLNKGITTSDLRD